MLVQEALHLEVLFCDLIGHPDERLGRRADVVDGLGLEFAYEPGRVLDQVGYDETDHAPYDFVDQAAILQIRIQRAHLVEWPRKQRLAAQELE